MFQSNAKLRFMFSTMVVFMALALQIAAIRHCLRRRFRRLVLLSFLTIDRYPSTT